MLKRHMAFGNLGVGIGARHVVAQLIGMEKIDLVVHRFLLRLAGRQEGLQGAYDKEA